MQTKIKPKDVIMPSETYFLQVDFLREFFEWEAGKAIAGKNRSRYGSAYELVQFIREKLLRKHPRMIPIFDMNRPEMATFADYLLELNFSIRNAKRNRKTNSKKFEW